MIKASNVKFTYLGAKNSSIKNINLNIPDKTLIRIIGDNGNGKTTLALALCGIVPEIIKGNFSGSITWNGNGFSRINLSNLVSFVFQDPYMYFSGYIFEEEKHFINSGFDNLLPNISLKTPLHKISSGEQQRIAIASALSRKNPLIILDEPFEYLDNEARNVVAKLLLAKKSNGDCSIIVIDRKSNHVPIDYDNEITVQNGQITNDIEGTQVLSLPSISPLSENKVAYEVKNLSYSYPYSKTKLIDDASFCIKKGESLGIVGSNGCGKTTLLLLLSGLLKSQKGTILFEGNEINQKVLRGISKMVFPNPETQIFSHNIEEELIFGMRNSGFSNKEIQEQLDYSKSYLPFDLSNDPFSLSFGQKKILSITASFLMKPKIILLDEPGASLDMENLVKVRNLINDFLEKGNSVVITSHDEVVLEKLCHRTVRMNGGKLLH